MKNRKLSGLWRGAPAAALVSLLSACAAPVPEGAELGSFISDQEIVAVTLAREGLSYYGQSRFTDAELKFRQALYLYPDLRNLQIDLAAALVKQGQYDEAESIYKKILEGDPGSVIILTGLAASYAAQERYSDAAAAYEKAYESALVLPDTNRASDISRVLSNLKFRTGDEEGALCHSFTAVALKPVREEYEKHLKLLNGTGHFEHAISLLVQWSAEQAALERDPAMLHQRAMASFGLGSLKQALSFEQLALANLNLDPALQAEMELVKGVVIRILIEKGEIPPDPKLEESAEREKFLEKLRSTALGNRTPMLYWPAKLIVEVDLRAGVVTGEDDLVRGGV